MIISECDMQNTVYGLITPIPCILDKEAYFHLKKIENYLFPSQSRNIRRY